MDYYRAVTAHVPLRPMGASPDGLGAYYGTTYTQGISRGPGGVFPVAYKPITKQSTHGLGNGVDPGGANSIAVYHPIVRESANGLGCGCGASSAMSGEVYPVPAWLTPTVLKLALGVGVLGIAWFLFGRKKKQTANARRRHRRNGKWSGRYKRSLPDSAFLYIEPGGKRHFPYKDRTGKIDLPHLRNAIARIPQSNLPRSRQTALQAKARSILQAA